MLSSSTYLDNMSTRISQNLSLRLSPERKYGPKYCPCTNCLHYPCKCCTLCHCFPCCCHSCCVCVNCHCCPCRCCAICHRCPCICCPTCHCNPCLCCTECHSFPCKCCAICHSTPCKCCPTCHLYPCRCCSECHCMPCKCCPTCRHTPCTCCPTCHCSPCVCVKNSLRNNNVNSPLRNKVNSPLRTCSPLRCCHSPCCSPCHSPCCSPCHSPCCSPCHCHIICHSPCVMKSPNRNTFMGSTNATAGSSLNRFDRSAQNFDRGNNVSYEESQFWDFLKLLMQAEAQIEDSKINLALGSDFNCEDAFRIFELDGRGFLTMDDLKYGLNLIGVYPTNNDLRLLMKRFDLQNQGSINYADFFDILVPFEKEYRNMVEFRSPNSCCPCRCPDVFSARTICNLKDLFCLIISLENEINNMRKNFGMLRLKLRDVFNKIGCGLPYFSNSNLMDYIQKNGLFTSTKNADLLFIRLDKNRNGQIDYREVEDEVTPLY